MITPRLEIDLDKIYHNASTLVRRLGRRGITVTGITKAFRGAPEIAQMLQRAGVSGLGDSRIENIERMRQAGIDTQITLVRSPMISQVDRVVAAADISFNTELDVIAALSRAAQKNRTAHGVVLMVELGDLREGIMPCDVAKAVQTVRRFPHIRLMGLGANLACRSGVAPDNANMETLSILADQTGENIQNPGFIVSGGNSSNLSWAFGGGKVRRVNNLRLGEAILCGRDPLLGRRIPGLYCDAITLVAEVIESKTKPSKPWGTLGLAPFDQVPVTIDDGDISQSILAIGRQDIDPDGLQPLSAVTVLGASSDHLVVNTGIRHLALGAEIAFQLNYSALLRAMTSPYVTQIFTGNVMAVVPNPGQYSLPCYSGVA
ncbi:alanine/ornithine racemase family PLP-dependent enzyme [Thalassospira sp. TSL5-1]|uniref:alanine/ornithine racemase family PLP-dependent enzyme n=1 Tax=Thalassospira sp. TSL5-1 TaxID=1544451 RepID=UPI0009400BFD|nr:alanine/ornithine racemase family PLP-dependent enzyme [Thalassospira sp. TSL5-1]OKH86812.1 alanine racemase [Thalassospira sp. TSL5-1]